jgi:ribosome-binding protein aMBF1 (putative translation factor)
MAFDHVALATAVPYSQNVFTLRPDNRIRAQRQHAGLSLNQLAERTGIEPSLLHRFENERDCPRLMFDHARLIAKSLGCRFVDLIAEDDLRRPKIRRSATPDSP